MTSLTPEEWTRLRQADLCTYILWWGGPFPDHLLIKRSKFSQISSSLHLLQLLHLLLPGFPQELAMLKDSGADDCIFEGKGWGVAQRLSSWDMVWTCWLCWFQSGHLMPIVLALRHSRPGPWQCLEIFVTTSTSWTSPASHCSCGSTMCCGYNLQGH